MMIKKKNLNILATSCLLFLNLSAETCLVELDPDLLEDGLQATLGIAALAYRDLREALQREKTRPLKDIALSNDNLVYYCKQLFNFQEVLHQHLEKNPEATIEAFLNKIMKKE